MAAGEGTTAVSVPPSGAEVVPSDGAPRAQSGNRLSRFLTGRIDVKIIGPYMLVMLVLAVLATFVTLRLMTNQLTQRFQNQLVDAGKAANSTVLQVEQEQLQLLRLMAATNGVDVAIVKNDPITLQRLLVPLEANSQYSMIDITNAAGQEVLALRPTSGPLARALDPSIGQWTITKQAASGAADRFGDKYSDLVDTSYGRVLYTAGPVKDSAGKAVGAVLVGMPLSDLIQRLTKGVLANVTIYAPSGKAIATTLGAPITDPALTVDPATFQRATSSSTQLSVQRSLTIAGVQYLELLGQLYVGHDRVAAALGVAVPILAIARANASTRMQMTLLFVGVVALVMVVGFALARSITAPIIRLVRACQMVASGDLDQQIKVSTRDETGLLTYTFNHMVAGLREREFVRDTFGKYMSKAVSERILSGELKLGGERRLVTLLNSDIRSFTTLSETMEPEDLVAFLNSYFHSMVDCVVRYEGVVDKFIGDAVIAVFGAPIPYEDHARRAMLTALEMRRRMVEFNNYLEQGGHHPIRIGIGLHTGSVVAGNIGSEVRMEYTCIGDTVDAADVTQLLTKEFKTDILVSDTTYDLVKEDFEFTEPHLVENHGTHAPIYGIIGLRADLREVLSDQGPLLIAEGGSMSQEEIDAQLAAT
ncbi:MAG: adenylate/guanylate cyclase domain-containing protein [Chloroflexota bacterium]